MVHTALFKGDSEVASVESTQFERLLLKTEGKADSIVVESLEGAGLGQSRTSTWEPAMRMS